MCACVRKCVRALISSTAHQIVTKAEEDYAQGLKRVCLTLELIIIHDQHNNTDETTKRARACASAPPKCGKHLTKPFRDSFNEYLGQIYLLLIFCGCAYHQIVKLILLLILLL